VPKSGWKKISVGRGWARLISINNENKDKGDLAGGLVRIQGGNLIPQGGVGSHLKAGRGTE